MTLEHGLGNIQKGLDECLKLFEMEPEMDMAPVEPQEKEVVFKKSSRKRRGDEEFDENINLPETEFDSDRAKNFDFLEKLVVKPVEIDVDIPKPRSEI